MPSTPNRNTLPPSTPAEPASATSTQQPELSAAVPLAVWSTPTSDTLGPDTAWTVPALLAQRLLAVYSHPGATVLAAGASARLIAGIARRLDRQPPTRTAGRRVAAGSVDLLIATPTAPITTPAPPTGARAADHDTSSTDQVACWAQQLRPAGVLAVVLAPSRTPDEPAAVVAAATGAGLTYLQHVVALTWPLHEDHLDPPTTPAHADAGTNPPAEPGHVDILMFTEPAQRPAPGSARTAEATHLEPTETPASAASCPPGPAPASDAAAGSVWPVAQTTSRAQRLGRYLPASVAHPGKMLPALARTAITTFTAPGELVLDPMCGIGTTLVEAVHAGRDAVGVEYEARWAQLARDNIDLAVDSGAPGHAAVRTGDARRTAALLGPDLTGRVRLLLTSPPYGSATHGRVHAAGPQRGKVRKWNTGYGQDQANLARRALPELLAGFTDILRSCLPLLAPDATVVLTTRPYRHHGALVDLPGAAMHTAMSLGLQPVGRYIALLAGIRAGHLVPRASFFQLANARAAHANGVPLLIPAHEDVIVLVNPGTSVGSGAGRGLVSWAAGERR
jgi:modification methylase